jgi:hypothetical protein
MKAAKKVFLIAGITLSSAIHAAPEISGTVTVSSNKASNIRSGGGQGSIGIGPFKGGSIDGAGQTNVNSLILRDGNVSGTVTISDNEGIEIENYGGGEINANSVVVGK